MSVQQIVSLPDNLLHRTALHLHRSDGMRLRPAPVLVNLLRLAFETDAVNFRRCRQGSDRDRHRVAFAFNIDDVLEEECFSLALLEPAKLPPHQRHQLRVLVDSLFDADELPALFKGFQMFSDVFVVVLFLHDGSFGFERGKSHDRARTKSVRDSIRDCVSLTG